MSGKLHGKVALVTGASSGIGEATALALAAEGAYVALAARRAERLEALVKQIEEKGGQTIAIIADVADEKQVQAMVQTANAKWGHLDILVNNAGLMLLGSIEGANTEDWRRMVNLNVLGLMYATHAVLPIMKAQNGGHIVNISSVAGRTARAGFGVYNATKWGVGAFSEALRQEVHAHHIRVTIIEPGVVETELVEH
ncbi:MAG: SDR family NAD(P)-dependent oxidoreductase, partial [Chloroflexi bacterium]|nr:SDR family NAD(P)-dependent oxidoreductase [Chloroflexota bacterium]